MPWPIQRVPQGLGTLLSTFGGQTPQVLADELRCSLEMLQFYGLTQLQTQFTNNAATAEGAAITIVLSTSAWCVLYGLHGTVAKTATMTAARSTVAVNRNTQFGSLCFHAEHGPFGATETGNASVGGRLPYPLLCPPGSSVEHRLNILGTDANANISLFAEFGILG
jgi:hypothetical protein